MDDAVRLEREDDPILRAATEWFLELNESSVSVERVAEWQRWLQLDKRHPQAFRQIEVLMSAADGLLNTSPPTRSDLAADRYDARISVTAWKARRRNARSPIPRSRSWAIASAALAASLLLASTLFIAGYPRNLNIPGLLVYKHVETPAGGTLKVILADGSAIDVGGGSSVRAVFTARSRTVTLKRGEAFFRVAKDAARPFTVQAGGTLVTAVGTAFNVRWSRERVVVAVAEGVVDVARAPPAGSLKTSTHDGQAHGARSAPVRLIAGQQLTAEGPRASQTVAAIDTRAVASWRDGRLRYLNEPLASVVADVARYTARPIEIADPAVGGLRITGTVLEHNLDGWLTSLEETFPITAVHNANGGISIEPRH